MRYHQPQGYFRHFTTQLRESGQNNQDCQTPSLSRQSILQAASLSQNLNSQRSKVQKSGNKQGLSYLDKQAKLSLKIEISTSCMNFY